MSSYGQITLLPSVASSFVACSAFTTPAAATTDMFEIFGSSTKTIEVLQLDMQYTYGATAPTVVPQVFLLRRTTANSSGTSTTETNVPLDTVNGSSTAVVKTYTANPTLGSSGGRIAAGIFATPSDQQTAQPYTPTCMINLYKADPLQQAITLRGTAQGLVVNFNGVKPGGTPLLSFRVIWTEK